MKNEDGTMMKEISKERHEELWTTDFDLFETEINKDGARYWIADPARLMAKLKKEEIDLMREVREGERGTIKHRRETRKIKDPKERYEWRNGWWEFNRRVYKTRNDWWRKQLKIDELEKLQDAYRGELSRATRSR